MSNKAATTSVFVYGTLKQGRPLDRPDLAAWRTAVHPASIVGSIYSLGSYPTVRLDRQGVVQGQVHEFSKQNFGRALALMDHMEGYDANNPLAGLYTRHVVEATLLQNEKETTMHVWAYEYNGQVSESDRLEGGVWEPGM